MLQSSTNGASFCVLGFLEPAVVRAFLFSPEKQSPIHALQVNSEPTIRAAAFGFPSGDGNLLTCCTRLRTDPRPSIGGSESPRIIFESAANDPAMISVISKKRIARRARRANRGK
jgi:hypothetical protein